MTRPVALRASALFVLFAVVFAAIGTHIHAPVAEAMFLVSGSLCAVMLFFAFTTPVHAPVPVRVRRNLR